LCFVVNLFRSTSREVVRLEGEARSPVYSSFGDALNARVTLRAYNMNTYLQQRTKKQIDVANSVNLLHRMLDRWNSMRLNGIMAMYATCLFFAAILIKINDNDTDTMPTKDSTTSSGGGLFDSSIIGLALVYSLQLMGLSSWTAMTFVQTENALTSVERLHQLMKMPQEADTIKSTDPTITYQKNETKVETLKKEETIKREETEIIKHVNRKLHLSWPDTGSLHFKNVHLRYRPNLPLALNHFNLSVKGGERLGIVGRTGAGKSSVFVSLLRLIEPESGSSILLDGIELMNVGLKMIRRQLITLIPQNPFIFSGSVRFNLDPYHQHDDEKLCSMLKDLKMLSTINHRNGLDSDCGQNGSLFSHGQRQLLVVGRALLQSHSTLIYLLDEATSSMDDDTDEIVQLAIKKHAPHITTIIVAHRLTTVLDCDRICVMDHGQVVQLGKPGVIANETGSHFAQMMETSGIPKNNWPKP
jgi:ABC-type multidrug transport system fused ATPase/permease subunit